MIDRALRALACRHCNFHKGPNLSGIDPESGEIVQLYPPRKDAWEQHFSASGITLVGLTPTGRATVRWLMMNAPARLELRREIPGWPR